MKLSFVPILFLITLTISSYTSNNEGLVKYTPTFTQFYTTSVVFSVSDTSGLNTSISCFFKDIISEQILKCKNSGFSCPCTGGEIIDLSPNTHYVMDVLNGETPLGQFEFKTASRGQLKVQFGLTDVSYTVSFQNNEVVPTSCSASVSNYGFETFLGTVTESRDECLSGVINNLQANTTFTLLILNNGGVMHDTLVKTGYYQVNVVSVGLEAFYYNVSSNIDLSSSTCEIVDIISGQPFMCSGSSCDCKTGVVTNLTPDTNYNFQFSLNGLTANQIPVLTASNGTLSSKSTYKGLNFTVSYFDEDDTPSHCYPCTWNLTDGEFTLDECREFIFQQTIREVFCKRFRYIDLAQGQYYKTILMDSFGSVVGVLEKSYVGISEIYHTSYQMKSINYKLNTELDYDTSRPCYILDSDQGSKRKCETNGVVSFDCPCLEGKMVDLYINSYVYTKLMQDNNILALDPRMYTADDGSPSLNAIGLYHFEYVISYYHNNHPPYTCKACLLEFSIGNEDCPNDVSTFGREVCRTFFWDSLLNGTQYRLRIFDGDGVPHTHVYSFTSDFPTKVTFNVNENYVGYSLSYFNSFYTPFDCRFYFEEDPSEEAFCQDFKCNCESGNVLVPFGTNYKKLVVTDSQFAILAKATDIGEGGDDSTSAKLSAGAIIGICIFILLILAIIAFSVALILMRKRRFGTNVQFDENF